MLNSITVRDYMTRHLLTFHAETDLFTAIDRLLEHRVHAAPVVDEHGRLTGLLSADDCLKKIIDGTYYEEVGGTVGDSMAREVFSISPETDIMRAAEYLVRDGRRSLPVVENDKLIGQVSRHDLLRAVKEFAQHQHAKH
ncbi:MAG TPA: CBS domain-containing protein [Pseudomonas sp.]|nr:CBS domain-containing protein [Pseudomonas sp.]